MDKMREEFEEWYSIAVGTPRPAIRLLRCGEQYLGEDSCGLMNMFFEVWQASRAALCVELPYSGFSEFDGEALHGYATAIDLVRDALIDAGVDGK